MIKTILSAKLPADEKLLIQKNEIKGEHEGKRLCVVTGTHGDELEGQYVCYLLTDFWSGTKTKFTARLTFIRLLTRSVSTA
ncbi:MAG: hypothetical protein II956_06980 [Bacteroidales bacterium]|nr:hypothetical protein [Bacteroidales bacterium]